MKQKLSLEDWEDYAFYESGLSAHGCLGKLDDYTLKAIQRYGRILSDKLILENKDLKTHLKEIEEYGTEEINAAVDLRSKLAKSLVKLDDWKKTSKKLYSVVLHLQEVAKSKNNIVVVGPMLYEESINAIEEYENLEQ